MTRRRPRPHLASDGGWLTIEFVGMLFLLLIALMLALQVAAYTYTLAEANGAARAAARAATLGGSPEAAARGAVSSSLDPVTTPDPGGPSEQRWSVTLSVPKVIPRMPQWTITRSASMPRTEPFAG